MVDQCENKIFKTYKYCRKIDSITLDKLIDQSVLSNEKIQVKKVNDIHRLVY